MAYDYTGDGGLDYFPCRYGKSKLLFRGPRRKLDTAYCACLGGSETYGKFVADPYPALVEQALGLTCVNFGYMNAGADVFVNEPTVIDACAGARAVVVQLMGVQNTSNRFYAVHPRRNDRFLRASPLMRTIFREVDFTEFNFTRHMLARLRLLAPDKFPILADELRAAWIARMKLLLQRIEAPVLLLWLDLPQGGDADGGDPIPVDEQMVAALGGEATVVRLRPSLAACRGGTAGMRFAPLEEPAAREMPGPLIHAEIAAALVPELRELL